MIKIFIAIYIILCTTFFVFAEDCYWIPREAAQEAVAARTSIMSKLAKAKNNPILKKSLQAEYINAMY